MRIFPRLFFLSIDAPQTVPYLHCNPKVAMVQVRALARQ